jgi:hypothetical protein
MKTIVKWWLCFVASLRLLSVFFGYKQVQHLREFVFDIGQESGESRTAQRGICGGGLFPPFS